MTYLSPENAPRRRRPAPCPHCSSCKTIQIDEHAGDVSYFCMNCEHTWTVTLHEASVATLLLPSSPDAPPSPAAAARARARATVRRSRALVAIAIELVWHALYMQRRYTLTRQAASAVH